MKKRLLKINIDIESVFGDQELGQISNLDFTTHIDTDKSIEDIVTEIIKNIMIIK